MPLPYRAGITAAASVMALTLAMPTATSSSRQDVNGHTDNWLKEGSPSVTYDNGTTLTRQSDVLEALQQCSSLSVSCASTTVEDIGPVTRWYDAENSDQGTGPIENCGESGNDITQTITAGHTFSWGWNVGVSVDVKLVKDKLGIGASAGFSQSSSEMSTGATSIVVKPGQKGMLKLGYDMDRKVTNVSIQGGKFGGAKITGLRTETPLPGGKRAGQDIIPCGQNLLNGR
ncbi:hypothetical protein [Streptomyces inhibens]|uniref:hypothetical protein n=1 Tax=Streptomyces inhibens TaxID=2293571 RepID=UPI001EE7738A|nr:hypothetical protein [Streptomyces inhibens]UKY47850.1 hypothetical protein KI385_02740 [Streptomyces inhibens]